MPVAVRGLGRTDRLLRARDFRSAALRGRRTVGRHFVMLVAASSRGDDSTGPRLGLTVSRKVGGAVVRNRVKRRVREWFRLSRAQLSAGVDLVVIARRGAGGLATCQIASELDRLWAEAQAHA